MLLKNVNIPIMITRVENHYEIKELILKAIDEMPCSSINGADIISKTDWNLSPDYQRNYWRIIEPIIKETVIGDMFKQFNCDDIEITNYWFQQYGKMDNHNWHVHGRSHWSNVYFVELPNQDMKTQILDISKEKLIDYEVKEGDIISFPAMLCHRSPPNLSDERKTIVSFNTSFMDLDGL